MSFLDLEWRHGAEKVARREFEAAEQKACATAAGRVKEKEKGGVGPGVVPTVRGIPPGMQ